MSILNYFLHKLVSGVLTYNCRVISSSLNRWVRTCLFFFFFPDSLEHTLSGITENKIASEQMFSVLFFICGCPISKIF